MIQDDIIRMAREAGFSEAWLTAGSNPPHFDAPAVIVERFAQLVAEREREKVARWQIGSGYTTGHGETIEDLLVELEWQVRESEREECAKVADKWAVGWPHPSTVIAEEIRARGNK